MPQPYTSPMQRLHYDRNNLVWLLSYQFEKTLNFEFHLDGPKLVNYFSDLNLKYYISDGLSVCLTELLISAHDTTVSIKIVPYNLVPPSSFLNTLCPRICPNLSLIILALLNAWLLIKLTTNNFQVKLICANFYMSEMQALQSYCFWNSWILCINNCTLSFKQIINQ